MTTTMMMTLLSASQWRHQLFYQWEGGGKGRRHE